MKEEEIQQSGYFTILLNHYWFKKENLKVYIEEYLEMRNNENMPE